ncbi:MAG: 4'-phosphopantetheinyl transferase superfamily protein [Muribaculaceae bacterium]|nr:4'-phosphopantetheinyl transferase superfamily protein [Muribaculaceae bacterium]
MIFSPHGAPDVRICVTSLPAPAPAISQREAERLCAASALRHLLSDLHLPLPSDAYPLISHLPSGAPFIPSHPELFLSVSHSAMHVAVAVSASRPVGIDIERWRPSLLKVARRFLSDSEFPNFSSFPRSLLTAWTIKEATFKLLNSPGLLSEPPRVMTSLPLFSPDVRLHVIDVSQNGDQILTIALMHRPHR